MCYCVVKHRYPEIKWIRVEDILRHLLSCSRLSSLSSSERPNPDRLAWPIPVINVSSINVLAPPASAADLSVAGPTSSRDDGTGGGIQLPVVARAQFLSVSDMKQAVSIETITSNEDEHCL